MVNTLSLQEEAKKQHNAALDNLRLEMRAKYDRIRHLEGRVTEKEHQIGNLQVNVVIIHSNIQSEQHEVSAPSQSLNASFMKGNAFDD